MNAARMTKLFAKQKCGADPKRPPRETTDFAYFGDDLDATYESESAFWTAASADPPDVIALASTAATKYVRGHLSEE